MSKKCLVADIGGTNARFALAICDGDRLRLEHLRRYAAAEYDRLEDAAAAYLAETAAPALAACFAVAAPMLGEQVRFINSPWQLNIREVRDALRLTSLRVLNDFEAQAAGVRFMDADRFRTVRDGVPDPAAPLLVTGPGTGLGQALVIPAAGREVVVSTEGGHVTFAPCTDIETEIWRHLRKTHSRVSVERLLSGPGLADIYQALGAIGGEAIAPLTAAEISALARTGSDPLAQQTVTLFSALLGRTVGDAVLATGARQGVVLAGGILPKMGAAFAVPEFEAAFLDKGRMQDYVAAVPVRLLMSDDAALYGAAAQAG